MLIVSSHKIGQVVLYIIRNKQIDSIFFYLVYCIDWYALVKGCYFNITNGHSNSILCYIYMFSNWYINVKIPLSSHAYLFYLTVVMFPCRFLNSRQLSARGVADWVAIQVLHRPGTQYSAGYSDTGISLAAVEGISSHTAADSADTYTGEARIICT